MDLSYLDAEVKKFDEDWELFKFVQKQTTNIQVLLPNKNILYLDVNTKFLLIQNDSPLVCQTKNIMISGVDVYDFQNSEFTQDEIILFFFCCSVYHEIVFENYPNIHLRS